MPQAILDRWRKELKKEGGANFDSVLRRRVEAYLDQGYGNCYLKDPRDYEHFQNVVAYIENNPVKARLCRTPSDWPYSSASFRAYKESKKK